MQLETRIRLQALAFGILLVVAEVAVAAAMSWWQAQPAVGIESFAQAVSAMVEVVWPYVSRIRNVMSGAMAAFL